MLSFLVVLSLFQGTPVRTYQPKLRDPGLHGGRILDQGEGEEIEGGSVNIFDTSADVTPDGRVRIGFRQQVYVPGKLMWALVATTVDTERIQTDAYGNLGGFYEPTALNQNNAVPFGEDYAFGSVTEYNVIYWSPPFLGSDIDLRAAKGRLLTPGGRQA